MFPMCPSVFSSDTMVLSKCSVVFLKCYFWLSWHHRVVIKLSTLENETTTQYLKSSENKKNLIRSIKWKHMIAHSCLYGNWCWLILLTITRKWYFPKILSFFLLNSWKAVKCDMCDIVFSFLLIFCLVDLTEKTCTE